MLKEESNPDDFDTKRRLDNLRNKVLPPKPSVPSGENDFFHLLIPAADLDNIDNNNDRIQLLPPPLPRSLQWLGRPSALTSWETEGLAGAFESVEQVQVIKRKLSNDNAKNFQEAENIFNGTG